MLTVFVGGHQAVLLPLLLPQPLSLALPLPLALSLAVALALGAGLAGQVQAGVVVEADALGLAPRRPHDGAAHLAKAQGGAVEDRVLGVVLEAVVDDEAEVRLEGFEREVAVGLQLVPHGLEVHRSVDVVQVVGDLRGKGRR